MSSISYDSAVVPPGAVNPSNSGNVIPLNAAAAGAYIRVGITHPVNASPDATLMYQYVPPPLSSSSSPYAATAQDSATQPTALPTPSFLNYAATTCQLPYYCPQYLQYPLAEAYQLSSPSIPMVSQLPPTITPTASRRFTPAVVSAAVGGAAVTTATAVTSVNNHQKRRFSSPLVHEKFQPQHQQQQIQQAGVEMASTAVSAPPVYEDVNVSLAQGRSLDADGGMKENYYNSLLPANQQHFYATAAAGPCYPVDLQLYATPQPASNPYWASRQPLAWCSRDHPLPPPSMQTAAQSRDDQLSASTLQNCCYSDLATALHNMRLWGSAGGNRGGGGESSVPSERGAYSPIQYANRAYSTASPSSQTSSSPFPTLCAVRLHQTEFDPKELARLCPGINPPELDPSLVWRTRYFVIKSNSTRNVMLSIQHGVWCSTLAGNDCLNRAYLSMQHIPSTHLPPPSTSTSQFVERFTDATATNTSTASASKHLPSGRVLLFFSVNTSGCFCGVAEMISPVDKMKQLDIWQDSRWRGAFKLRWIYAKNVPNRLLRHIQVESAENRAVTHLRDTNEILPASKGEEMLQIIHNN